MEIRLWKLIFVCGEKTHQQLLCEWVHGMTGRVTGVALAQRHSLPKVRCEKNCGRWRWQREKQSGRKCFFLEWIFKCHFGAILTALVHLRYWPTCCLTWWAHRFPRVVGWRVSQSSPTAMLQPTQQMLQHTTEQWLMITKLQVTYCIFLSDGKYWVSAIIKKRKGWHCATFILSTESVVALAWWMRWVCSMYSVNRCRKLRGSLNITGMAIFDNSWKRCLRR